MFKKVKWYYYLLFIALILSIVFSYAFPEITIISIVKDISLTLTLTISFTFTINLKNSFNKYETNIKEIIIQEQNIYSANKLDERASAIIESDSKIINRLITIYKPIQIYFKQYDFSTPHRMALFDELMNACITDFSNSAFRFSDNKINSLLEELKEISKYFIGFMSINVYPIQNNLMVTKHWERRKRGYHGDDLSSDIEIENTLNSQVDQLITKYKEIIDLYYEMYTPQ